MGIVPYSLVYIFYFLKLFQKYEMSLLSILMYFVPNSDDTYFHIFIYSSIIGLNIVENPK